MQNTYEQSLTSYYGIDGDWNPSSQYLWDEVLRVKKEDDAYFFFHRALNLWAKEQNFSYDESKEHIQDFLQHPINELLSVKDLLGFFPYDSKVNLFRSAMGISEGKNGDENRWNYYDFKIEQAEKMKPFLQYFMKIEEEEGRENYANSHILWKLNYFKDPLSANPLVAHHYIRPNSENVIELFEMFDVLFRAKYQADKPDEFPHFHFVFQEVIATELNKVLCGIGPDKELELRLRWAGYQMVAGEANHLEEVLGEEPCSMTFDRKWHRERNLELIKHFIEHEKCIEHWPERKAIIEKSWCNPDDWHPRDNKEGYDRLHHSIHEILLQRSLTPAQKKPLLNPPTRF